MSAPRLNVPLMLEDDLRIADGMGGYRRQWRALGLLYADMTAGTGRVRQGVLGPQSVVLWRITVRGAAEGDLRRPRAGQRFRLGARAFVIDAVAEAGARGMWLVCSAREEKQA